MTNMWMVRAGDEAVLYDEFRKKNIVAIGWGIGDVRNKDKDEIKELLREKCPKKRQKGIPSFAGTITRFISELKEGDYVVSVSDKTKRNLSLGVITSDYYFDKNIITDKSLDPKNLYNKIRNVKWLCEISRDELSDFTNEESFHNPGTLFEINEKSVEEILSFIDVEPPFENNHPRNVIYFGAPGTGKSHKLDIEKNNLILDKNDYERVTFHPDYSYANFVGTYKPFVPKEDSISYKYVPGPFMRTLVKALRNPNKPFLLIIEEINRSNVAAVFGDIFQLLDRDKNKESKFPIETTEDMRTYLEDELKEAIENDKNLKDYLISILNEDYSRIKIPSNMFIWATMNSADQGVFPMDTAFKRRWDFEYFGINREEDIDSIEHIKVNLNGQEISWNAIRTAINNELLTYKINEDKLLGPFFAFNEYVDEEEFEKIDDEKFEKIFRKIFKNKIIMYLFEDAAKAKRDLLFSGVKEKTKKNNVIYSEVCDYFDSDGLKIFCENIRRELDIQ